MTRTEDAICDRTLKRLIEQAEALGVTPEELLKDVLPETRARLLAYIERVRLYPEGKGPGADGEWPFVGSFMGDRYE